jgi:hypothetical protein
MDAGGREISDVMRLSQVQIGPNRRERERETVSLQCFINAAAAWQCDWR